MPIHLIPILVGGGLLAAGARGAAWIAEQNVKEVNGDVQRAEAKAAEKNRQYASQRAQLKKEFEELRTTVQSELEAFLEASHLSMGDVGLWEPEPWLRERIGELVVRRPLLIQPSLDRPPNMHQVMGSRLIAQGQAQSRTNPNLGQNMQAVGAIAAAGGYISDQVNYISEAKKFAASAKLYIVALEKTIEGFDSRFAYEAEDDRRSVERLRTLLYELKGSRHDLTSQAIARSCVIVQRRFIEFLAGLVERYS